MVLYGFTDDRVVFVSIDPTSAQLAQYPRPRGELGSLRNIHSAQPGLPVTTYYREVSHGLSAVPILIPIHSYSRYDHLVAFVNALTTRFPAIIEGLEFDRRRMAILVLLTGRTR